LHEIPVLKITLLLLHVIPVLNQTGPTHTQILDMICASFSTFEINTFFYEIFIYFSVFQKRINFDEILKFVGDEQFKYLLVLESINDIYYGFNLKNKLERKTAKEIVLGNWKVVDNADEYVIGWKVAKELPSWVNNAVAWEGFVIDTKYHAARSEGLPLPEESISDDMSFNSEGSGMKQGVVANMDDSDDVGEEENALYDEEEENDGEDEEQDADEVDTAKDEEEEEQEDSKVGEETYDNKEHMSYDIDDTDKESDANVSTNVHPKAKKQSSDNTLKYSKKSAHNLGNVEDAMFKNLFSGDLKPKVAENVNKSSKTNSIGVYIKGPFCNSKTCKSHWVVVYGDNGNVWMLKSEFIYGYLIAVLPSHRQSNMDINHCHTYEDIHICKDEFGTESVWRRRSSTTGQKDRTIPRISFVYSCVTMNEKIWKQGISEAVKIFFMSMEKRDLNQIVPIVLEV
jgi:hypothetical protein